MVWLLLLAVVASLAATKPSTPPSKAPDVNEVLETCMASGRKVGECMALLRREA
jgi:hypothetical protein